MNWLIVLAAILPLLFSRDTIDTNITPRYIFLCSFILLFVLFFYAMYKTQVILFSLPVKILFGLGISFGLWSIVCMANAINVKEGYYEVSRHVLNLIFLFLVMTTVINEEPKILNICKSLLLVSMLHSFVGILQNYGIAFTDLPGNYKPYGLMANRNLFGSAQALLIPFTVFVLHSATRRWKIMSIIALIGIIISVLVSQTRSAWLGSIAILFVSLLLVLIFSPANRKKWMLGTLVAAISIAAIISVVLLADAGGDLSKSIKERAISLTQPNINKIDPAAADNTSASDNAGERIKFWEKTIELIKDKPVYGAGPSNWKVAIAAYVTNDMVWAKGNYVPDRPHNVYLQVTSETGIPGAIFYFGMWIVMAVIAFKVIRTTTSDDRRIIIILMFAGLSAFAIDCMFSFPAERIEHSIYMTLMGGIILGCYTNVSESNKKKSFPVKKTSLAVAIAIILFNLFIGFKKNNFEIHAGRARENYKTNNFQGVINEVNDARNAYVTLMPDDGWPVELWSAIAYKELRNYTNAMEEITNARFYNPNSAAVYNNMGTIYTAMNEYENAVKSYQQALQFAPEFESIYINLAVNYYQLGKDSACIAAFSKVNQPGNEYLTRLLNDAKLRLAAKQQQTK